MWIQHMVSYVKVSCIVMEMCVGKCTCTCKLHSCMDTSTCMCTSAHSRGCMVDGGNAMVAFRVLLLTLGAHAQRGLQ